MDNAACDSFSLLVDNGGDGYNFDHTGILDPVITCEESGSPGPGALKSVYYVPEADAQQLEVYYEGLDYTSTPDG